MSKLAGYLMVLALVGCAEQQKRGLEGQQSATQTKARAVEGTRHKVAESRNETKEDTAAKKDLPQLTRAAVSKGEEFQAQRAGDETHDTVTALRISGAELRCSIRAELDDLHKRTRQAQHDRTTTTVAAHDKAEAEINELNKRNQALRAELRAFEPTTTQSLDDFKRKLTPRLSELRRAIEKAEKASYGEGTAMVQASKVIASAAAP